MENDQKESEVKSEVQEAKPSSESAAGTAPKVMPIISIGVVDGTNELAVSGQIHNKRICLNALADAIKIITNINAQDEAGVIVTKDSIKEKSSIITPG